MKTEAIGYLGFFISLILTTLTIVFIGGSSLKKLVEKMVPSIWKSVGVGAITFITLPLVSVLLLASGIGAYLGVICFLLWVVMILLAIFFAGISFGQLVLEKITKNKTNNFALIALFGMLCGYLILLIPILGFIFFIFILWWGMGGITLSFAEARKTLA